MRFHCTYRAVRLVFASNISPSYAAPTSVSWFLLRFKQSSRLCEMTASQSYATPSSPSALPSKFNCRKRAHRSESALARTWQVYVEILGLKERSKSSSSSLTLPISGTAPASDKRLFARLRFFVLYLLIRRLSPRATAYSSPIL